jgi:repressor LexA
VYAGSKYSEVVMKGLTEKQRRVFDYIRAEIVKKNRPPTIREIGGEFGMNSTGSVRDVLRALVKKGFVEKDPGISRGIRIKVGPGPVSGEIVELPVIGKITAGTPVYDYQNIEETLKLDKSMVPEGEIFVVKVGDDSMTGASIDDGDYAFIRRQPTCRSGQIVAVVLDDKITLKEFAKKGGKIHLLAKNKRYKPVIIDPGKFSATILGVLVGAYRRF